MGTYFDDAQAKNADHKRKLLEAMAQGGMAGKQSFEQAQQAITANRVQALDRLLGGAQKRNAGSAAEAELAAIAGTSSQRNLDNLAASRTSYEQNLGAMQQANASYMDQAAAAVPAIQAASDRELALFRAQQQAKLDAEAAKAASDMPQWQIQGYARGAAVQQRETAEQELARILADQAAITARTASGGPGMGLRGYETTAGQASQAQAATLDQRYRDLEASRPRVAGQVEDMTQNPYLYEREAAVAQYGIDPHLAAGLFPEPTTKDRIDEALARQQAENLGTYGARTPSEAVREQGAADKLAGKGIVREATEAARIAKVDPKLVQHVSRVNPTEEYETVWEGSQAKGEEAVPYDDAIATAEDMAKDSTANAFNEELASFFTAKYGHDFPQIRALVTEMYRGLFAGQ